MPKLILDLDGGDFGSKENFEGACQALGELEGELILIGHSEKTRELFQSRKGKNLLAGTPLCKVSFIEAHDEILMEDSIKTIRTKPQAAINLGLKIAAEDFKNKIPSAFISAGHSGVVMAAAFLSMGRLTGVSRPAIAIKLPTIKNRGCVLLDVGANIDCTPENLRDFALMGALFAKSESGTFKGDSKPKVGILSNGEEKTKGTPLTREAVELIEKTPCFSGENRVADFMGYTEGKEIFKGSIDVVVTDGFTGNVVLKSVEGLGSTVSQFLKNEYHRGFFNRLGFLIAAKAFMRLKKNLDYAEYGAAPLAGVAGYCFICHGRSNAKAIKNALLRAQSTVRGKFVENLSYELERIEKKETKQ